MLKKYALIINFFWVTTFSVTDAAQHRKKTTNELGLPYQRSQQQQQQTAFDQLIDAVIQDCSQSVSHIRNSPPRPLHSESNVSTDSSHIRSVDLSHFHSPINFQNQNLGRQNLNYIPPSRQHSSPSPQQSWQKKAPQTSQPSAFLSKQPLQQKRPQSPKAIILPPLKITPHPQQAQQDSKTPNKQLPSKSSFSNELPSAWTGSTDKDRINMMEAFAEVSEAEICLEIVLNKSPFMTAIHNSTGIAFSFLAQFVKKLANSAYSKLPQNEDQLLTLKNRMLEVRQAKICNQIIIDESNFKSEIQNNARLFIKYFTEKLLIYQNQ